MYKTAGATKLHIVINGQDYTDRTPITNQVIGDKDRLLISYGDFSQDKINTVNKAVGNTAANDDNRKVQLVVQALLLMN